MEEFLSGTKFEQMAREYNAKYGKANVLQNDSEFQNLSDLPNKVFTQDKEKKIKKIEKDFEKISSLFLFVKKHINRLGKNNISSWGNFYYIKLEELEKLVNSLKQNLYENL